MDKILYALLLCLGSLTTNAGGPAHPTLPDAVYSCNLPAPGNFHVTNVGPTFVSLQWNAVPGAAQYKLATTEMVSGSLVSTVTLSGAATSTTVSNLQMGTPYLFTIWCVCGNGEESPNTGTALAATYIIVDIIVQAQIPGGGQAKTNCPLSTSQQDACGEVDWSGNGTPSYFQIQKNTSPYTTEYFSVCTKADLCDVNILPQIRMIAKSEGNLFSIVGDNNSTSCSGAIIVKYQNTAIGNLLVIGTTAGLSGRIYRHQNLSTDYTIYPANWQRSKTEQDEAEWTAKPTALNPFTDHLDVSLPTTGIPTDLTTLALFDLNGRPVRSYQVPGDIAQVSLSTADLPVGLYFLRITGADGRSETLRVVKGY